MNERATTLRHPYTISESRSVAETQAMDPYHRDIMKFLLAEIERLALECRAREVIMSHMKVLGEAVAVYERAST